MLRRPQQHQLAAFLHGQTRGLPQSARSGVCARCAQSLTLMKFPAVKIDEGGDYNGEEQAGFFGEEDSELAATTT